jgi:putative hydrolase
MRLEVDTHTHTVLSGHAHSTLLENVRFAKEAGLKGIVLTEHGPNLAGGPPEFNIGTYQIIPEYIDGIRIYTGVEADILDFTGTIDISETFLKMLDFVLVSLHDVVIGPGTMEENTQGVLAALDNPYVDVIAHPGYPYYPMDYEALILGIKKRNKLVEINNHSFVYRAGSHDNCVHVLRLCKKHGVRIIVSSDAHICFNVGHFERALEEVRNTEFPEELIVNRTTASFEAYLEERKSRLKAAGCL